MRVRWQVKCIGWLEGLRTFRTRREAEFFIESWRKCDGNDSADHSATLLRNGVPLTDSDRPITQDDLNAAARGLKMVGMSLADLDDLIKWHKDQDLFASRVIVAAAKQIRAVKLANGARS